MKNVLLISVQIWKKASLIAFIVFICGNQLNAQVNTVDTSYQGGTVDTTVDDVPDNEVEYSQDSSPDSASPIHIPDTVTYRFVPDTVVTSLQKRKEFEYANDPDYWMKNKKDDSEEKSIGFLEWLFFNPGVKIFMYVLLAAVLLFAIYKVIINNNLFYRGAQKKTADAAAVEEIEMETDLESKIAKAMQAKDYRKAVRYLYVKSLRELDQKNLIRYHAQATNYDYLAQVSDFKFAGRFSFLTQVYDYVWYGGFEMSDTQFDKVLKDFNDFYKEIGAW